VTPPAADVTPPGPEEEQPAPAAVEPAEQERPIARREWERFIVRLTEIDED
jgi:hypothetical protein